jgi:hypothetical protein
MAGERATSGDPGAAKTLVRVVVQNVIHPGKSRSVDAARYEAMRQALLKVLPARSPGLPLAEVSRALLPRLPAWLFPGGTGAGRWLKTVQLDLEAEPSARGARRLR